LGEFGYAPACPNSGEFGYTPLEVYHWHRSMLPRRVARNSEFAAEMPTLAGPAKFCAGKVGESRLPQSVHSGTPRPAMYR
jgi:hypothetical protein